MNAVRRHPAERDRLDSLASYGVLDTAPEVAYDELTALAARLCRTPIAMVNLVGAEHQWSKSVYGIPRPSRQLPRELSFCSDAVASCATLVISDASKSARYAQHPAVTGESSIRAYAGVPLVGRDGLPLGAFCVLDQRPRRFSAEEVHGLTVLARQVVVLLEQRRSDRSAGLLAESVIDEAHDPARLRHAIERGELVPHFQPIVDIRTGRPFGLEALLRWEHPRLGVLLPEAFLPAIEASALVVPAGRVVLEAALAQLSSLRRQRVPLPGGVCVNIAGGQLSRPGLARDVLAALARHGVPGHELALEITEATALADPDLAVAELSELAAADVHIVIDDFGVGWSNLARVLRLPVAAVKLDRSIVSAVLTDRQAAVMAASTVGLVADLGLDVVAEGIETDAVRRHLEATGYRWGQGWLWSAAVPAASVAGVLHRLAGPATTPGQGLASSQPIRSTVRWMGGARPLKADAYA
ncbi:MAG: EAL domain-containing protein [Geodermatophilaceae bacterium]|nr:EAL domain-containing protein [Geodermatophilaceae bacterium]